MSSTITVASAGIEESVWLIEINPDPEGVGDPRPSQMFMPSGAPLSAIDIQQSAVVASVATIKVSDRGWIQEPRDTGAEEVYPPRLLEPPAVERFIPVYPGEGRRSQIEAGELRLRNVDGALDSIAGEWAIGGREVKLIRAPHRRPNHAERSTWVEVASLRASEAFEGTDTLRMPLRSAAADLLGAANSLYTGAGGAEGDASLRGVSKPRIFGFVRNVQPTLVDAANRIYQLHDGEVEEIVAVRDLGGLLELKENEDSYASLVADSPATGKYTSFKGGGFIKLHDDPVFLTADVRGSTFGGYASTAALVAAQILQVAGGVASATASTFSTWPNTEVGIIVREGTAEDAMDRLAAALGSVWWGPNTLGEFGGGVITSPESATIIIEPYMLLDAPQETSGSTPPWWRLRVAYQEIDVTQEGSDVSDSPLVSDKDFYSKKRRYAVASDANVKIRYPLAVDGPELPGVIESKTAASTLAESLLTIYKAPRRTWTARIGPRAGNINWWALPVGTVVKLKWPAIPTLAGEGKDFLVRGISARGDYAELELWG